MMKKLVYALPLLLAACGTASSSTSFQTYLARKGVRQTETGFEHCTGYGCQKVTQIALSDKDWAEITRIFKPAPKTAAQERIRIAKAVGLLEQKAGAQDGTAKDIAGTFRETGQGQLDCVDESTNTTLYISMLLAKGLVKFHGLEGPTMRLPIINAASWPHQTAVIRETATGERFAVDSWFQDNGAPADVIDLKAWKNGWKPDNVDGFL